jgi:hypothetical protein
MALNDILKYSPALNHDADHFARFDEAQLCNFSNNKLLNVPPFENVSENDLRE